ncbi:unnamed protein product [Lasius platythorax]|uniref:Uncharacterized protein n=1 Tax=Lasius platythorax TaxID=488582 RepID=A0AAV2N5W0_9HYME
MVKRLSLNQRGRKGEARGDDDPDKQRPRCDVIATACRLRMELLSGKRIPCVYSTSLPFTSRFRTMPLSSVSRNTRRNGSVSAYSEYRLVEKARMEEIAVSNISSVGNRIQRSMGCCRGPSLRHLSAFSSVM